jgi:hypothetical protein
MRARDEEACMHIPDSHHRRTTLRVPVDALDVVPINEVQEPVHELHTWGETAPFRVVVSRECRTIAGGRLRGIVWVSVGKCVDEITVVMRCV